MRARLVTVFFAGFALGLVFLAVLLWQTGMLRTSKVSAALARPQESQESQEQPQRPDTHRATRAARPLDPPAEVPHAATETPTDRRLTARRLIIPVRGVQAEQLREDFIEMRRNRPPARGHRYHGAAWHARVGGG